MKKICSIAILSLIFQTVFTQVADYTKNRWNLKGDVKSVNEISYSADESEIWEKHNLAFDEKGNLLLSCNYEEDVLLDSIVITYKNGYLLTDDTYEDEGDVHFQSYFTYWKEKLVSIQHYEFEDSESELMSIDTFIYSGESVIVDIMFDSMLHKSTGYIYDEHGRVIKETGYKLDGSIRYEAKMKYFGDEENGDLYSETVLDSDGALRRRTEYTLENKVHILTTKNKEGIITSILKYKYNSEGDEIYYANADSKDAPFFEFYSTFEYDEKGNWIIEKNLDKEGNITGVSKRTITYYE